MECGWGWEAVIKLSKLIDYTFVRLVIFILLPWDASPPEIESRGPIPLGPLQLS